MANCLKLFCRTDAGDLVSTWGTRAAKMYTPNQWSYANRALRKYGFGIYIAIQKDYFLESLVISEPQCELWHCECSEPFVGPKPVSLMSVVEFCSGEG